jgi:uncharacterized protein RhaS with RHS repeats
MRKEYDFSRGKRRAILQAPGKTRITIRLDDDLLRWFRAQVRSSGGSYQTLINLSLRDYIAREPLEATLRRVVREELARAAGRSSPHSYDYDEAPAALVADSGDPSSQYGASLKRKRRARHSSRRKEK